MSTAQTPAVVESALRNNRVMVSRYELASQLVGSSLSQRHRLPVMPSCLACGHENREGARFCDNCGAALEADLGAGSRRTVTILFSDVVGSTELGEQLDPERLQSLLGRYFDAAREVIQRHGGTVEKFIGDAVVAVFGIPRLREDDALRAVRAAADIREALDALDDDAELSVVHRLRARTGVHTGEVIVGDAVGGGKIATGDAMNVAARLEQSAGPDEILISEATHRLVQDAVQVEEADRLELRGRGERVQAYRLLKVDPLALGFARRLTAPMVGRDRELSLLRAAFDRAVSDWACQLVTVLGAGGVGKSRLLGAFVDELGERATVLQGRCLPYGDGITFWPIIEAVRPATGLSGSEDPATSLAKIAALIPDDDQADRIARQVAQIMGLEGERRSARRRSGLSAGCSRAWRERDPSRSSSTTCNGRSPPCSSSSNTSPSGRSTHRSSWHAWRGRSCWR